MSLSEEDRDSVYSKSILFCSNLIWFFQLVYVNIHLQ